MKKQELIPHNLFSKKVVLVTFIICIPLLARESEDEEQLKVGNLAVPGTMQPGPLLGFGQNIITSYEAIAAVFVNWLVGKNKNLNEIAPLIIYGLRDDLSVFLAFPTAARFKSDGFHSSGSEDIIVQFEYAFYAKHYQNATNQCSFVTAVHLPSGNECKNPATGFGSPSFFLGVTADHLATEWYCYTSYGALLTTKHDNSKSGNQFFYQAGFGKNIAYRADKWTFMWMVELYGWYEQKSKINNIIDENSGFNVVILGPSLWFSNERLLVQGGIAPVVSQHIFGVQPRNSFFATFYIGWRFG